MNDLINLLQNLNFSNVFWQIITPLTFSLLDVVTGFIQAVINNDVDSQKMRVGLLHKLLIIIIIFMSFLIQFAFNINYLSPVVCIYIIIMELVSILENIKKAGIDIGGISDILKEKTTNTTDESLNRIANIIDDNVGDGSNEKRN